MSLDLQSGRHNKKKKKKKKTDKNNVSPLKGRHKSTPLPGDPD
jgi:hypothetical protein